MTTNTQTILLTLKNIMKNLTILLLLVSTMIVNAADIVVNGSGLAGTYTTISAAVQAANEGDKILVFLLIKMLLYYLIVILHILILKVIYK